MSTTEEIKTAQLKTYFLTTVESVHDIINGNGLEFISEIVESFAQFMFLWLSSELFAKGDTGTDFDTPSLHQNVCRPNISNLCVSDVSGKKIQGNRYITCND
jgi:hypothetical protein